MLALLLTLLTLNSYAADKFESAYTSLDHCTMTKSSENDPDAEIDYFESVCRGRDGYTVYLEGGDARSWLRLTKGDTTLDLQAILMEESFGNFPNVTGGKLEWRYKNRRLVALIVRMDGYNEESGKTSNGLVVIRVNADNTVVSLGRAATNQAARELADRL